MRRTRVNLRFEAMPWTSVTVDNGIWIDQLTRCSAVNAFTLAMLELMNGRLFEHFMNNFQVRADELTTSAGP